jgi:hypothetical protein
MTLVVMACLCTFLPARITSAPQTARSAVLTALSQFERTGGAGNLVFQSVEALTSALDDTVPKWVAAGPALVGRYIAGR